MLPLQVAALDSHITFLKKHIQFLFCLAVDSRDFGCWLFQTSVRCRMLKDCMGKAQARGQKVDSLVRCQWVRWVSEHYVAHCIPKELCLGFYLKKFTQNHEVAVVHNS